jgi:DNA-binding MltR family transcriptional regulator
MLGGENERLRKLAYLGDHEFPDLTWKARCLEANEDLNRARTELAAAQRQLWEASQEINCAGPIAHRIRILKQEHEAELLDVKGPQFEKRIDAVRAGFKTAVLELVRKKAEKLERTLICADWYAVPKARVVRELEKELELL